MNISTLKETPTKVQEKTGNLIEKNWAKDRKRNSQMGTLIAKKCL